MAASKTNLVKCVVVGDGACGKTCMLISYVHNSFPTEYVPTIFANYTKNLVVDGKHIRMSLWDTAGQDDYERLRPLSYTKADVVLICYAIDSPISLKNVKCKWIPEVQQYAANTKFIIVGTKIDLRGAAIGGYDEYGRYVEPKLSSYETGKQLAVDVGASGYLECSAMTQEGLQRVFEAAAQVASLSAKDSEGCDGCNCTVL
eukprot:TRINITY_DN2596_c0_g1_i1.p1 TRINITY_DN2596_c0_g1~~TRINITY_DN2596_c0_g1_i1.p1  ORF type:complete len:202 (-),score=32.31 TRINITY_DN2596_c0_g1_i1:53-658(-)